MKVVVAEKPSVARDLAEFLGARTRRDGYLEGNGYQVTWAFGHLVELKEPQDYDPALKRWSIATLPFIPAAFELKVSRRSGVPEQFGVVARLLAAAELVVCATDAGREGELIFRYIVRMADCEAKPVRRLWLSSLTESAIRDAFAALRPGSDFDNLYAAARCRSESDWIVGLNATRNYTVRSGNDVLWSVGRVQTPVLALICRRDDEIRNFVPKAFFDLLTRYRGVAFRYREGRFDTEVDAGAMLEQVAGHPFVIGSVKARTEKIQPPQLHDLTELQREMNRRHGLSAADTLEAAQALYEAKLITYPRTDSRYLTQDLKGEVSDVLAAMKSREPVAIGRLDLAALPLTSRVFDDKKVSDHHAIIPTGKSPGSLSLRDQRVFDAVLRRLIAAFYPPCVKEVTTVEGHANQVPFVAKGVRVVDPGFTAVLVEMGKDGDGAGKPKAKAKGAEPAGADDAAADDADEDTQELPAFVVGESGPHEPFIKEGRTKPPARFTENSLLGAMETAGKLVDEDRLKEALKEKGLGTPATRAAIIETLLHRRYIQRERRNLIATDLGRYLIAVIQDPLLKSAELTGEWEGKLKQIERGELDAGAFMREIVDYTRRLIVDSGEAAIDRSRFGACPRCGRAIIEGNRNYGCSAWQEGCTYLLPKIYKGMQIQPRQAQELLQRRLLRNPVRLPEESRFAVLLLSDAGVLMDIDPPSREQQTGPAAAPAPARAAKVPVAAGSDAATGSEPKRAAGRARVERSKDKPATTKREPAAAKPAKPPACPVCAAGLIEQDKAYRCGRWREGCRFVIWKEIAGKKISKAMATRLLTKGRTQVLKGFQSKAGKPFDARLKLEGGQVRFEFDGGGSGAHADEADRDGQG